MTTKHGTWFYVVCEDGYEGIRFAERDRAEAWIVQFEADARQRPKLCQGTHLVEERHA